MTILSALRGKPSKREIELSNKLDKIGAEANAFNNNINREPTIVDHLALSYPRTVTPMNGETKGLQVRLIGRDEFCQVLEIKISSMGFSPAHIHPHYCVTYVESGAVLDTVRDHRYDKGEWYMVQPHEVHSAQSVCVETVLTVYNTSNRMVAESILANKKYDVRKIHSDKLKFNET